MISPIYQSALWLFAALWFPSMLVERVWGSFVAVECCQVEFEDGTAGTDLRDEDQRSASKREGLLVDPTIRTIDAPPFTNGGAVWSQWVV
ncbi:MAG: hypothetical protein KatS3mg111_3266 [Pirellulaceae bacterium]|nr:MAG: hypothetical protein KatS3mg111_3266 [Pirellulaceae bacterium]